MNISLREVLTASGPVKLKLIKIFDLVIGGALAWLLPAKRRPKTGGLRDRKDPYNPTRRHRRCRFYSAGFKVDQEEISRFESRYFVRAKKFGRFLFARAAVRPCLLL